MSFCKLKNEKVMYIWSDNIESETMDIFPKEMTYDYDLEYDIPERVKYSEIELFRCDYYGNIETNEIQ